MTARGNEARANKVRKQAAANRVWQEDVTLEEVDFERDVLPGLANVPVRELAKATGLSLSYCSGVRSETQVHHKRHWRARPGCSQRLLHGIVICRASGGTRATHALTGAANGIHEGTDASSGGSWVLPDGW